MRKKGTNLNTLLNELRILNQWAIIRNEYKNYKNIPLDFKPVTTEKTFKPH